MASRRHCIVERKEAEVTAPAEPLPEQRMDDLVSCCTAKRAVTEGTRRIDGDRALPEPIEPAGASRKHRRPDHDRVWIGRTRPYEVWTESVELERQWLERLALISTPVRRRVERRTERNFHRPVASWIGRRSAGSEGSEEEEEEKEGKQAHLSIMHERTNAVEEAPQSPPQRLLRERRP